MSRDDDCRTASGAIEDWIQNDTPLPDAWPPLESDDRTDWLLRLLAGARRASTSLTSQESERLREEIGSRLVSDASAPGRWARPMRWLVWATAAGLLLASAVGLRRDVPGSSAPAAGAAGKLVKELFIESMRDGKTLRLEVLVYRSDDTMEDPHATSP